MLPGFVLSLGVVWEHAFHKSRWGVPFVVGSSSQPSQPCANHRAYLRRRVLCSGPRVRAPNDWSRWCSVITYGSLTRLLSWKNIRKMHKIHPDLWETEEQLELENSSVLVQLMELLFFFGHHYVLTWSHYWPLFLFVCFYNKILRISV